MLDEPSANLDPRARRELLEVLARIERTMLVTTHDLPLAAELCERAVILARGRVVADGACREILGDPALRLTTWSYHRVSTWNELSSASARLEVLRATEARR